MAMSVSYTTINGQIVYENRGGVESYYAPDTLGSTAALLDHTGAVTDTFTYWPFGEIQNHVGSNVTPFTYCGTLGYYLDAVLSWTYVRARYYTQMLGNWMTLDPLWPREDPYSYSQQSPFVFVDPTGMTLITLEACIYFRRRDDCIAAAEHDHNQQLRNCEEEWGQRDEECYKRTSDWKSDCAKQAYQVYLNCKSLSDAAYKARLSHCGQAAMGPSDHPKPIRQKRRPIF